MKIYILTENKAYKGGILAEHGLSVFIEHDKRNILFDTGQSDVYARNALQMNVDLSNTDLIVLSHGHYDHCGGLPYFPNTAHFPVVYIHKEALNPRYAINQDGRTYRKIGIPWSSEESIKKHLVFNDKTLSIASNIWLLSEIPYTTDFEEVSKVLFTGDDLCKIPDQMKNEQMLIIERDNGLCVFLGCSHPGIINCLKYALSQFPGKKIDTLLAGMHLEGITEMRMQKTMQAMREMDIQRIIPLHCTGVQAIMELKRFFGDRCFPLCAGDTLEV